MHAVRVEIEIATLYFVFARRKSAATT